MKIKYNWLLFAFGLTAIMMWKCAENPFEPILSGVHEVSISNNSFNPGTLTIDAGEKVKWINNDDVSHSVDSGSYGYPRNDFIGPENLDPHTSSDAITFSNSGTFPYYCIVHKEGGTINVN